MKWIWIFSYFKHLQEHLKRHNVTSTTFCRGSTLGPTLLVLQIIVIILALRFTVILRNNIRKIAFYLEDTCNTQSEGSDKKPLFQRRPIKIIDCNINYSSEQSENFIKKK